jgi:hypothetical protein
MDAASFMPRLDILPPAQRRLWDELDSTPDHFTLYGGTALALRLGHRVSMDFDFFSNQEFDPDRLARAVAFLDGAERVQVNANTLTCRVDRDGPVLISFFGGLGLGQAAARENARGYAIFVASLLDLAGTKAAVIQKRAEEKDYLDIDALLRNGVDLPTILAAGGVVYGRAFNPLITLKALAYFSDVPKLAGEVKDRLRTATASVDPRRLPVLPIHGGDAGDDGGKP